LTALPESLGNLRSLTHLDVRANRLISLPASIGDLAHLEKLDVRWNKLSSLPEWLQRLEQRGCTVFR
jgi:Leucine-rich repeat (LRR) protein